MESRQSSGQTRSGRGEARGLHGDRENKPHREHGDEEEDGKDSLHVERTFEGHAPQDFGELSVSQRERPQSEVRSRV